MSTLAVIILTHSAFHFGMKLMADKNTLAPGPAELNHFQVHLGNQRAGGVEYLETPAVGLLFHLLRDTVGAENHNR